jgi:regulatory protein
MAKVQMSLKARALRYLSSREHSRLELGRKLSAYAQEGDDVEALLDQLEVAKFLSEQRFSESLVRRRATRFGNSRILMELQSHGIEGEPLQAIKTELAEDEFARACSVLRKKYDNPPDNPADRAKYMRFLQQRGFSHRAIQYAIKHMEQDDDEE